MGKSGIICRKIAATLASTGTPAFFLHPAEAVHGDLGVIQSDDVVIAMSYSGETEELTRVLETLKRIGAPLIALTGGPNSTLAQAANVALDCSVSEEACPMNLVPTASTTAALAHGRCAGDDGARREGLQARGLRQPASRRQARQAADARRAVDGSAATRCRSCSCTPSMQRRDLRNVAQGPRHDVGRRKGRPPRRHHHRRRPPPENGRRRQHPGPHRARRDDAPIRWRSRRRPWPSRRWR